MSSERCEPPAEHRRHRWHWLRRGDDRLPVEFEDTGRADIEPLWLLPDSHGTPAWAYGAGWRYVAPAVPPEGQQGAG